MAYTFARVSAVVGMNFSDYRHEGKRARLRLVEKRQQGTSGLAAQVQ